MEQFLNSQLFGAVIGSVITLIATFYVERKHAYNTRRKSTTLLLLYLEYVRGYLKNERGSVNIRFSSQVDEWISECDCLDENDCRYIMDIYNLVYSYHYHYELKEKNGDCFKEDIAEYKQLQKLFFDNSKGYIDDFTVSKRYDAVCQKLKLT